MTTNRTLDWTDSVTDEEAHKLLRLLLDKLDIDIWELKLDGEPRILDLRYRNPQ